MTLARKIAVAAFGAALIVLPATTATAATATTPATTAAKAEIDTFYRGYETLLDGWLADNGKRPYTYKQADGMLDMYVDPSGATQSRQKTGTSTYMDVVCKPPKGTKQTCFYKSAGGKWVRQTLDMGAVVMNGKQGIRATYELPLMTLPMAFTDSPDVKAVVTPTSSTLSGTVTGNSGQKGVLTVSGQSGKDFVLRLTTPASPSSKQTVTTNYYTLSPSAKKNISYPSKFGTGDVVISSGS